MGFSSVLSAAKGRIGHQDNTTSLSQGDNEQQQIGMSETKAVSTDREVFSDNAQTGVQKVEAAAMVWPKSHLIAAYAL